MARFSFAAALLPILMAACTSPSPVAPGDDAEYPTTIAPLSAEALADLNAEFFQANPRLCSPLNEYGFTQVAGCIAPGVGFDSDPDVDAQVKLARDAIVRNSRFTGTTNPSDLVVRRVVHDPSVVRIDFEPQVRSGLTVEGTVIAVALDSQGPRMVDGNHYPDIHVPASRFPAGKAQSSLLGFEIHYFGWTGEQTFVVGKDSFYGDPVRVVFPLETESGIELRVAWRVVAGLFAVYVDTVTLERIAIRQLVIF